MYTDKSDPRSRRYDLDWLRILAVLLLVPFHSALVFALDPKYVVYIKDHTQSDFLIGLATFINLWHMPLFFAIAGMSTWFALNHRTPSQYRTERVLRLLVPFVFGVLILIPAMTYIRLLGAPDTPSFWNHYLGFFNIDPLDLTGVNGTFTPGHLWFILYLFIFSLAALPLCLWLRSSAGLQFASKWLPVADRPGMFLLLAVPLTLAAALPVLGDKNPIYFMFVFIAGFLLTVDERFAKVLDRDRWLYLGLSLLATPIYFWTKQSDFPSWSAGWIGAGALFNGLRWTWVLAILGWGNRCLNANSALLRYCSEAAYPFYILHLPIDTLVAWWVIQWNVPVAIKYLGICVLTIGMTLAIYDTLVRRSNITRFLFGMKPLPAHTERRLAPIPSR